METKSIILAALLGLVAQAGDQKCRALVMSGGGTNGAWEAGVMWGLTHYGNPEDYYWEVHSGISAGSINTIGSVGWAPEDTVKATQYLSDMWASLENAMIYKEWVGHGIPGLARSCLTNISCVDDSPALEWLRTQLQIFPEVQRRFSVSAVDVNTGDFITFDQTNIAREDLPQAALSSSSIPGFFPPQHFKGHVLMDGGTVYDVDPVSAIQQCLEVVENEEDIIMDILLCENYTRPTISMLPKNSMQNFKRSTDIKGYYSSTNQIAGAQRAFPNVNYRNLFLEQGSLGPPAEIDFRNQTTWPAQMNGREQAQDQLKASENGFDGFRTLSDWNENMDDVKDQYTNIGEYFKAQIDYYIGN